MRVKLSFYLKWNEFHWNPRKISWISKWQNCNKNGNCKWNEIQFINNPNIIWYEFHFEIKSFLIFLRFQTGGKFRSTLNSIFRNQTSSFTVQWVLSVSSNRVENFDCQETTTTVKIQTEIPLERFIDMNRIILQCSRT